MKIHTTARLRQVGILVFFVLAAVFLLSVSPIYGQDQQSGLRITPTDIREPINPGDSYSQVLKATNLGSETQQFYIVLRDIEGINQDGAPVFSESNAEKTGFELTTWITVPEGPVEIAGGATKEIPFSIAVPQDAAPGSHFGGIFLSREPIKPETIGTGVGFQVGTVVVLRVAGDVVEDARIREFSTDKDIYSSPTVTFTTRIENPGNVLVQPRGPIDIVDFLGRKVATVVMNSDARAVFPNGERSFSAVWQGERLSFGRYEAVMSLVYGDEVRRSISSATSFWVLPLNIILPVFAVLLALVFGIVIFVRLQVRRRLAQMGVSPSGVSGAPQIMPKGAPFSKLVFITIAMLLFTLVFLVLMFIFFA